MFDSSLSPDLGNKNLSPAEMSVEKPSSVFTPLPDSLANRTATEIIPRQKSTLNQSGSDDMIAQLEKQLAEEAVAKGINPDNLDAEINSSAITPPRKVGLVGRIKGFFSRAFSWGRNEITKFLKGHNSGNVSQKNGEHPNSPASQPGRSQPLAPPTRA